MAIRPSTLTPDAQAASTIEVVEWLDATAEAIRRAAGPSDLECCLWAYQLGGSSVVFATDWGPKEALDSGRGYSLTIIVDDSPHRRYRLSTDPLVPTAAEALHLVSQLVHRLAADVSLPPLRMKPHNVGHSE